MQELNNKLNKIKEIKNEIKDSLVEKGCEVTDETPFEDYPAAIDTIKTGGGGEIVDALIPAEYTDGYAEGTPVLLNTKEYYMRETEGFSYTANRAVTNTFPLDNFMSVGYQGYAFMRQDGSVASYSSSSSTYPTVFFPISQNTFVNSSSSSGLYRLYKVTKRAGEAAAVNSVASTYPVVMLDAYSFGYIPFITPKDNPSEVNMIQYSSESNSSWTYIRVNKWDLESNTTLFTLKVGLSASEKSSTFRNVGVFSTDISNHLYALFYDPTNLAFSTYLWDSVNGFNQITQSTTLDSLGGFQYAVQFPNTLTINGEEVMYSFVYTGGDLHVYSFKESTMEWQEEPQIALTIKNVLGGAFGNEVSIQPQVDGTLYCMNNLTLAGFSFNEDGTITEVEHPFQKWLTDYPQGGIFASVNKFAKSACLLYANAPGQMQNVIYFNLEEHPDTGEIQWVLYDKNRNNYAKESITGIATGSFNLLPFDPLNPTKQLAYTRVKTVTG